MTTIPRTGKIQQWLITLRSGFWFVPGLMVLGAIGLAWGLVQLDLHVDRMLSERWPRFFATGAEGSRAMLSAIAGSMITVAGVVFSITIVVLAQASTQYTSRVLRNFMRDRANQVVLGVFLGVFTYCLIVLRTISGGDDSSVPLLGVLGGIVLALVAIGFLIFFIHHVAASIQAGEIAASVTHDTLHALDRLFPHARDDAAEDADAPHARALDDRAGYPIPALRSGYLQGFDGDGLMHFATRHDGIVRMACGVGDFVAEGTPLAHARFPRAPDRDAVEECNRLYAINTFRTTDQDPAYGIRQLVDIALKGLSPGINDTTTAVTCLDYLSVILRRVAGRCDRSPCRMLHGELRLIAREPTFEALLALAIDQVLENAEGNAAVLQRLARLVGGVAEANRSPQRRAVLRRHLDVIAEVAARTARSSRARDALDEEIKRALRAVSMPSH